MSKTPRPALALSLALVAGLALSACSDDTPSTPTGGGDTDGATSTENALPLHPTDGWWCQYMDKKLVDAATGGRSAEATQVVVSNDGHQFRCEVQLPATSGDPEVAIALDVIADDAAAVADARAKAQALAGVVPGPTYLGESYVAPGYAVALVPCGLVPGNARNSVKVPWALTISAPLEPGQTVTDELTTPLNYYLKALDQSVGCSPKQAIEDESPTTGG